MTDLCPSCYEPLYWPSGDGCANMTAHDAKEGIMTDYSDWKVWKEVELHKNQIYLSEHKEYQPEELAKLFQNMIVEAESQGLQGCYLTFRSTYEQYEDYLGPVAVMVCGYRKLNLIELKEAEKEEEVEKLAKEMDITVFEARTVYNLKQRGKL